MTMTRREVVALGGAGMVVALVPGSAGARPSSTDDAPLPESALRLVDPELRAPFLLHPSDVDASTLSQVRMRMDKGIPPYLVQPAVVSRRIPGRNAGPDVRILVMDPLGDKAAGTVAPRPALLYLHGGGYVAGSAAGEVAMAQEIALEHSCVVISVDYRLAPETPFPGALEDNYAALTWLHSHAGELGVDVGRIALMGTSAGGGHVATLSAAALDRGEVPILFQLMLSPMLDDRTGSSRKVPEGVGNMIWTPASNRFGWSSVLGVAAGSESVPLGAVPARRIDLKGLPPTYIGVGAIDLFVDENVEYARRLADAGVPLELNVVPGAYHVFFAVKPDAGVSRRFRQSFNQALTRAFSL